MATKLEQSITVENTRLSDDLWTVDDVREKVQSSRVVVFSKGSEESPKCGFSKRTVQVIRRCGEQCEVVDVSNDGSLRAALAAFSGERALPLVYVDGELVPTSSYLDGHTDGSELEQIVKHS